MKNRNPKTQCLVCGKPIHNFLVLCTRCRAALIEVRRHFDESITVLPNKDEIEAQFDMCDEGKFNGTKD